MKKVLVILAFTISALEAISQSSSCALLQQYAGEWKYENSGTVIKVSLRSHEIYSTEFAKTYRMLFGWIEYKNGGNIIESTYSNRFMNLPPTFETTGFLPSQYSISLYMPDGCNDNLRRLAGFIRDAQQNGRLHTVEIDVNAARTELTWHQFPSAMYPIASPYLGTTLPQNFVLVKQP